MTEVHFQELLDEVAFEDVPLARRLPSPGKAFQPDVDLSDPDSLRSRVVNLVLTAQARVDLLHISAQNGVAIEDGPDLADYVLIDLAGRREIECEAERRGWFGQFTFLGLTLALTADVREETGAFPHFRITQVRQPEKSEMQNRRRRSYQPDLGVGSKMVFHVFPRMPFGEERKFLSLLSGEARRHQAVAREL